MSGNQVTMKSTVISPTNAAAASPLQRGAGTASRLNDPWRRTAGTKQHQGFSLIEILVTILVVSIGLLGLAALQVTGLKVTESAKFRTLATLAAYGTIDRFRADPTALIGNNGSLSIPAGTCGPPIAVTGISVALKQWYMDFCAFGLPRPTANSNPNAVTVNCTETNCGTHNCEIEVFWDDARAENNLQRGNGSSPTSTDKSFRTCTRLPI
jgi:type IV pilus assembly protein PilV